METYLGYVEVFIGFSMLALLVMNIERYLGAYYPIFHRTAVTRRRLLTLLIILEVIAAVIGMISENGLVISSTVFLIIFTTIFLPLFMFVNFKLFTIARKVHRERTVSPGKRTTINLKNISMGLWVFAFLILLYIPEGFYIAFDLAEKSENIVRLSFISALTCNAMNCTFNSLIFFWKNKVLRTEGIKILKTLKDCLVGS